MIIGCTDLDGFFDGELGADAAAGFRDHLGGCACCQRVLHGRMQEAVVVDPGVAVRAPDAGRARRRRVTLLAALVPVLGAAAAVVTLSTAKVAPLAPLQVALSIDPAGPILRGTSAHLGDELHVTARGARHRAIWVYRNDHELVASCPERGAPAPPRVAICDATGDTLELRFVLVTHGSYAVVTLGASAPLPTPSGALDTDIDAASRIDGSYQTAHLEVD